MSDGNWIYTPITPQPAKPHADVCSGPLEGAGRGERVLYAIQLLTFM